MGEDARESTLFRTERLRLGEFWCAPKSTRWRTVNVMPASAHVVFPRTTVAIRHLGRETVVATRNHVMFYNPGQRYLRALLGAEGDHCFFVEVDPATLAEISGREGELELGFPQGPNDPAAYLLQELVMRHVRQEAQPDRLFVEEALGLMLGRAVEHAQRFHRARPAGRLRPATRLARRDLVEQAKALLAEAACERLSLADLGRRLHTSEFHLARVFRAETGQTLHGYRTQLRLRLALDRLAHPAEDLAALARGLGFASHSHFNGGLLGRRRHRAPLLRRLLSRRGARPGP